MPLAVSSVFLNYSFLRLDISFAYARDFKHSSVKRLFFLIIELFKFKVLTFPQLVLSHRYATPSSLIKQSSAFISYKLEQYCEVAKAWNVTSVTFLQFIDKSMWVSLELLGDRRKYLRPLSQTDVSWRSSFFIYLTTSLSAK